MRLNTVVTGGRGTDHLGTLTLHDVLQERTEQVPAAALFVLIGGSRAPGSCATRYRPTTATS